MIKANDLRIGNLFYYWPAGYDMVIDTVVALRSTSKTYAQRLIKGSKSGWHQETQCHPIPLTPEVLEKAGFILMNRVTQRFKKYINETDSECICLELSEVGNNKPYRVMYDYNAGTYLKRKVPYLHDLQNLYHSLTGTELTLNLCTATTQNDTH